MKMDIGKRDKEIEEHKMQIKSLVDKADGQRFALKKNAETIKRQIDPLQKVIESLK